MKSAVQQVRLKRGRWKKRTSCAAGSTPSTNYAIARRCAALLFTHREGHHRPIAAHPLLRVARDRARRADLPPRTPRPPALARARRGRHPPTRPHLGPSRRLATLVRSLDRLSFDLRARARRRRSLTLLPRGRRRRVLHLALPLELCGRLGDPPIPHLARQAPVLPRHRESLHQTRPGP